jgi:polygalacturonase
MKSSEKHSPAYRRKFLAFLATATASVGVTSVFSRDASKDVSPKGGELEGSVRRFGAKGDGKADDSAAVQSAIDSRSGSVYFPKGIYRITKTIEVDFEKVG